MNIWRGKQNERKLWRLLRATFSLIAWRLVGCLCTGEWLRGCQVTVEGTRRFGLRTEMAEMRWDAEWVAGIHRRLYLRV